MSVPFRVEIEELPPVATPLRVQAALVRNLPFVITVGKVSNVNFVAAAFVGHVG